MTALIWGGGDMLALCVLVQGCRGRKRRVKGILNNKLIELDNFMKTISVSEDQKKMASTDMNFLITGTHAKSPVISTM